MRSENLIHGHVHLRGGKGGNETARKRRRGNDVSSMRESDARARQQGWRAMAQGGRFSKAIASAMFFRLTFATVPSGSASILTGKYPLFWRTNFKKSSFGKGNSVKPALCVE